MIPSKLKAPRMGFLVGLLVFSLVFLWSFRVWTNAHIRMKALLTTPSAKPSPYLPRERPVVRAVAFRIEAPSPPDPSTGARVTCIGLRGKPEPCRTDPSERYLCIQFQSSDKCVGGGQFFTERSPGHRLEGVRPRAWTGAVVGPDDRTIMVGFYTSKLCDVFDRIEVVERPDSFVVTLFTGEDRAAMKILDAKLLRKGLEIDGSNHCRVGGTGGIKSATIITFPNPLLGRQLFDGSGIILP
jgi:hypothetical protein